MDAAPAAAIVVTVLILIGLVIWGRRRRSAAQLEARYRTIAIDLDAEAASTSDAPDTIDLRGQPAPALDESDERSAARRRKR